MQDKRLQQKIEQNNRRALIDYFASQPSPQITEHHRRLVSEWKLCAAGLGFVSICALTTLFLLKTCFVAVPVYQKANLKVDKPLIVYLSESLASVSLNEIKISPAIDGKWTFKSSSLVGRDQIIFKPTKYFKAGTSYKVTFGKVKRLISTDTRLPIISFTTEHAPGLANNGVKSIKDNTSVTADYAFSADLEGQNNGLRKIELRTDPEVKMIQTIKDDKSYTWKPAGLLPQGKTLTVEVYDSKNDVVLAKKIIKVADEPAVSVKVKENHFVQNDIATITFNQPIEPDSSKFISFSVPGTGKWQSDNIYTFTPKKVNPGQTYSYTIKAGMRSKSGGILTADQTLNFATTGNVYISSSSPSGNELPQANEQIRFTFDQPVDHASVASRFSISAGRITGTSWQGNTYIVNVADLGFQKTVTATIAAGVINTGFGLPSVRGFSQTFTTEYRSIRLSVPYYRQQYSATCAAASLRMALAYRGILSDDMSIVNRMGYNPTVMNKSSNPPTWDDPQQMFVGSVNGSIEAGTSAGPDAPTVARAAQSFGRSASDVTGASVAWIAQQIYNNNPVVMFGASGNTSKTVSWTTPSGRTEVMNISSHARTVIGVKGEPGSPVGFWVSDPLTGIKYWSASSLAANINLDPYRQAVVVY